MNTDLVHTNTTVTTVPVAEKPDLPPPQIAALGALLSGKTATDAAAAADIGRRTLYDWIQKDCRFQAALNRGRRDLRQAVGCRVEQLAAEAAECVAQSVRKGNVKAAMEILKGLKLLAPRNIGSDDERTLWLDQLEEQRQLEKRDRQLVLSGFPGGNLPTGLK
jgi:hypothetical protein